MMGKFYRILCEIGYIYSLESTEAIIWKYVSIRSKHSIQHSLVFTQLQRTKERNDFLRKCGELRDCELNNELQYGCINFNSNLECTKFRNKL